MTGLEKVVAALDSLGGEGSLPQIYDAIERADPSLTGTWKNTFRAEVYRASGDSERTPVFRKVGRARFALAEGANAILRRIRRAMPPLQACTNLILEGVPGTGKTHIIKALAAQHRDRLGGDGSGRFAITLHPATSYEDFVEGLRPGAYRGGESTGHIAISGDTGKARWFFEPPGSDPAGGAATDDARFAIHDGFFLRVCGEAVRAPDKDFIVLLDEINRCNVQGARRPSDHA